MKKGFTLGVHLTMKKGDNLSKAQREVLHYIVHDFLTVREVANRRKTTVRAVYKTLKKLRQKGLIQGTKRRGFTSFNAPCSRGGFTTSVAYGNKVRLHGQEFNIKIINKTESYDRLRHSKSIIHMDGNTVRLYKNSIEVYCSPLRSFLGKNEQEAERLSLSYFQGFFAELEHRLNILIIKGLRTQIKQVNGHYALTENELAKDYEKKHQKLKIKDSKDAKTWFLIDNSFQLHEAETVHPESSKDDMSKVRAFFNDIKAHDFLLSDIAKAAYLNAENMKFYAENMKSHVKAVQELEKAVKKLTKVVEKR